LSPDERTEPSVAEAETSGNGAHAAPAEEPLHELIELLQARFAVLVASIRALVAVHTDRAQLALRRRIQGLIVGALAAFAGGTMVVYSVVHVVRGAAQGFTELFEGRTWLGSLTAGLFFLLLIAGGLFLALRRWDRKELDKQREKYASLQRNQVEGVARAEAHGAPR